MIGTHTVKLINARAKQDALCANIVADLDKRYITSSTVKLSKQHWACPYNAADMRKWKDEDIEPVISLPDIQDGRAVKQILLPMDNWQQDGYVATSPIESLGLLHELYLRAAQTNVQHRYFEIEPTPAARANHGELMLEQKGKLCLLTRGITNNIHYKTDSRTSCVAVRFEAQNTNISSGFFALGHPAITAVGGLVHAIERDIGQDIKFAIGLDSTFFQSQRRYSRFNKSPKKVVWGLTTELTAHLDILLLLECEDLPALYSHLSKRPINRFAGGSVWNYQVELINDECPPMSNYIVNAIDDIDIQTDALDAALELYHEQPPIYSVNQIGYAFLEEKTERKMARNGYDHVWSEPIYSMVKQAGFTNKAWWKRGSNEDHVAWY